MEEGLGAHFVDESGRPVLAYDGLKVFDAFGAQLPARLLVTDDRLQFVIDDRTAVYPITIDPTAQRAYIKASNTGTEDIFGYAVAISGDTMVVGAPSERSASTGVDGDQTDDSATYAGAAYVFVRRAGVWTQEAYLKPSNTVAGSMFGFSVGISGDTIVVGAIGEASAANGVNGNQFDGSAPLAGAAYVFERSAGLWSQSAYLKASNTDSDDMFGYAVAISGDTVVVGAPYEDSAATGLNGNQMDNSVLDAGAAYVFERHAGSWAQAAYLKASNTGAADGFGYSAAIDGDTIAIGAPFEAGSATGSNGNQIDESSPGSGAAYLFVRTSGAWAQQAYLKASNTGFDDHFGVSVAVSKNLLVIGAPGESSASTGVNGGQSDNSASGSGAAYLFSGNAGVWAQSAYLKASNTDEGDGFGSSVAISDGVVVVGAPYEDTAVVGESGDQADNSMQNAGAIYVFAKVGSTWSQRVWGKAPNAGANDWYGLSTAIAADSVAVGAPYEDSAAVGVGGNQTSDGAQDSGAAYALVLDTTPDPFSFTPQHGVALSTAIESGAITVSGIDIPTVISVVGGGYRVGSGVCTSNAGTILPGESVYVCIGSSNTYQTTNSATLTIGGVLAEFSVTTLASSNAKLGALTLSTGSLSPTFAPGTESYTAAVSYATAALTLTPTVADAVATVKVNNLAVASGNPSAAINLAVGSNTVTVEVTAQDGSTRTYTVVVTRQRTTSYAGVLPGGGQASVSVTSSAPGCGFGSSSFVSMSAVPEAPPPGYDFTNGLFQFSLAGCQPGQTIQVAITYPSKPGAAYWKYGPTTADPSSHWYQIPASVSGNTITFSVTDGGLGDDDLSANGTIVDLGGPAIAPAAAVPSLTAWAMVVLSALLALLGLRGLHCERGN
ncbi:MAG: hypothetical protein RJA63_1203 [Pseudomonadota bacterium]